MAKNINKDYSKESKAEIFRSFREKTYRELAADLGLAGKTAGKANSILARVKNEVIAEPEKFGVSEKEVEEIVAVLNRRSLRGVPKTSYGEFERTKPELLDPYKIDDKSFKELVLKNRDKAGVVISRKLDLLLAQKKRVEELKFSDITSAFSVLFDKAQILQGQATENIAIKANIRDDISPEEAIEIALKMREDNIEKNKIRK